MPCLVSLSSGGCSEMRFGAFERAPNGMRRRCGFEVINERNYGES